MRADFVRWPLLALLAGCTLTDCGGVVLGEDDASDSEVEVSDTDDTFDPTANRLANGGFEYGESWWRPAGYANHNWSATAEPIYGSEEVFTPYEGSYSQKIWGFYSGSVPNDSEHGLDLAELTAGDDHVFSAMAFTPTDDAVSGGSEAVLFIRYYDATGDLLGEYTSEPVDEDFPRDSWEELSVGATVPTGAVSGALGLRFTLADWSAGGSVYLDGASWTSTGTGEVVNERLLVFHDEFEGSALDETVWTRLELPAYTYNNEMQTYTDSTDNADVSDGQLVITAALEDDGSITSARLVTDGTAEWTYGRIEGMLTVPAGVGTWPAMWMLPSDWAYGGWPDSGEIDIMEHVGCDPDMVYASVHTGAYNHTLGTQQTDGLYTDATSSAHLYAVDWSAEEMHFTVDGETVLVFANDGADDPDTWPFDQDFHLLLNLAFGGDWGGYCGVDTSALPQAFRIDWVRVYQ